MKYINIVGGGGSGKSRLGKKLAERLNLEYIELDAIHWQKDWQPLPKDEFRKRLINAMDDATKGWVVDGSYSGLVGDIVLNRTDTLLYLKISRLITIPRELRRGFGRWLHRELLWGVNRETPINTIKLAFWVFTSYKKTRETSCGDY